MQHVLVTDGEDRHSLAIIRSLGKQGLRITSIAHDKNAISFHSKYVTNKIVSPLSSDFEDYGDFLLEEVRREKYDVLVTCTEPVINILSARQEEFRPYVKFVLPPMDSFRITKDKISTLKLAEEIGVPMPRTLYPKTVDEALKAAKEFDLPIVIKGSQGSGAANVRIVKDRSEFEKLFLEVVENLKSFQVKELPMIQEFIEGSGVGFSTIYSKGKRVAYFMHRRLLQYPSHAGQCVIARQIFDPELERLGTLLFDALNWHSVGMAEFRQDARDGKYKLMEINPRFWGSIDLPIRLGIDFADYYYRLALQGDLQPVVQNSNQSKDFVFLFPHSFISFMESPRQYRSVYKSLNKGNILTDFDREDLGPFPTQLRLTFWHMRKHLRKFGFRNLEKSQAGKV